MINLIIDILSGTSSVTDIVPADRIFPLVRLQGSEIPAIVVQLTGGTPVDAKDLPSTMDVDNVQVTAFAVDPATAWAAMEAVRAVLDGYQGGYIAESRFVTHASDIFETTEVFSITARYDIRLTRDGSSSPISSAALGYDLRVRGAVTSTVEVINALPGEAYYLDPTDWMIFVDFPPGADDGDAVIYLPPVADNEGRELRLKAGGNVDNQHRLTVRPYPGDSATIDGQTAQSTGTAYCATHYLCHGGAWWILTFINKF